MNSKVFFVLIFILPLVFTGKTQETLELPSKFDFITPQSQNLSFFVDMDASKSLEDILTLDFKKNFQKLEDNRLIQENKEIFWVYFEIKSKTDRDIFLSFISRDTIGKLYMKEGEQENWQTYSQNYSDFQLKRPYPAALLPHLELKLKKNKTYQFFIKSQNLSNLKVFDKDYFVKAEIPSTLFLVALCLGALLALFLYNVILFSILKDKLYLYYIVYLVLDAFAILAIARVVDGFTMIYHGANVNYHQSDIFLLGIAMLLFSYHFLKVPQTLGKIWKYYYLFLISICSSVLLLSPFITAKQAFSWAGILALLVVTSLLVSGFWAWLGKKYKVARFFVLAFSTHIFSVYVFLSATYGIFPETFIFRNSVAIGSVLEAILLSFALADRITSLKKEKEFAQEENLKLIEAQKEDLEDKVQERTQEILQNREEIQSQNEFLKAQRNELEATLALVNTQQKQILDSITYAKQIQTAILPSQEKMTHILPAYFVLFRPRDIVSGDFYYIEKVGVKKIIATVDCTGHGVPGAFMSLIANSLLNEIILLRNITNPSRILEELHTNIRTLLKQEEAENRDGMDMSLVIIDDERKILEFSGAKSPLIYIQNQKLTRLSGDRTPIGGEQIERERFFSKQEISFEKNTSFYIFSDGFQDQFGGNNNKKLGSKRLRELLFEIHQKSMKEQKSILENILDTWKGKEMQIDDILVLGVKL